MNPEDTKKSMFGDYQRIEILKSKEIQDIEQLYMLMGPDISERRDFIFDNINFDNYLGD